MHAKAAAVAIAGMLSLLPLSRSYGEGNEDIRKTMVGVWQDSNVMADGWGDAYQFFPDGKFVFHGSQMNWSKREITHSGTWKIEGKRLVLSITERFIVVGGEIVEDTISATGKDIKGGVNKIVKLKQPKQRKRLITTPAMDKNIDRLTMKIDGVRYWKYYDDPNEYK